MYFFILKTSLNQLPSLTLFSQFILPWEYVETLESSQLPRWFVDGGANNAVYLSEMAIVFILCCYPNLYYEAYD